MAVYLTGSESRPRYRLRRSCGRVRSGTLTPTPSFPRTRFGSAKRPKTLICAVTDQRLETEANGIRIGLSSSGRLGFSQQMLIDVQRLLHPYDYAICVWSNPRTRTGTGRVSSGVFGPHEMVIEAEETSTSRRRHSLSENRPRTSSTEDAMRRDTEGWTGTRTDGLEAPRELPKSSPWQRQF